jgi:integrase
MATITDRGKLQWRARVRRKGYPIVGKTFETKADAEKWARQIESEMDRGIFVSRTEAEKTTLSEALERYKDEYVPKLSHFDKILSRVNLLQKRDLSTRFLASIRGKDIADFIKEREREGVSANTIRLDLATLSKLFDIASKDWGMESLNNPVQKVNKPKLPSGRTRRLEGEEEIKLLQACSPSFSYVIRFALETAMRREEISSLTWDNVDLTKRSAFLPKTKNGEARSIPLSPVAISILREIDKRDTGLIFNMSDIGITHAMIKACKKAEIENLHFHGLRHEATSRFFENTDLDIMEIRAITGHKTLQMLVRYTHLRTARLADRLAGMKRVAVTA